MRGIERIMERTFEAGLTASRAAGGNAADCPYDERFALNLRKVWIYGFISGKTGRPCRCSLRLTYGLCHRILRRLSPEANALIAVTDPRYKNVLRYVNSTVKNLTTAHSLVERSPALFSRTPVVAKLNTVNLC